MRRETRRERDRDNGPQTGSRNRSTISSNNSVITDEEDDSIASRNRRRKQNKTRRRILTDQQHDDEDDENNSYEYQTLRERESNGRNDQESESRANLQLLHIYTENIIKISI